MERNVELVIFDCDGVLVDSELISAQVGSRVLADLGWDVTPQELVQRFAGCSEDHWRTAVEVELGRKLPQDWDAPYRSWYEAAFEAELRAVPGVVRAIGALPHRRCVASNGPRDKILSNLRRTGLAKAFEGRVFSAEDVQQGKPAPDLFLHAARSMGVEPRHCVVVEDSPPGLAAARAAGMRALAYASGLVPVERLIGGGATIFHAMAELPELIG